MRVHVGAHIFCRHWAIGSSVQTIFGWPEGALSRTNLFGRLWSTCSPYSSRLRSYRRAAYIASSQPNLHGTPCKVSVVFTGPCRGFHVSLQETSGSLGKHFSFFKLLNVTNTAYLQYTGASQNQGCPTPQVPGCFSCCGAPSKHQQS